MEMLFRHRAARVLLVMWLNQNWCGYSVSSRSLAVTSPPVVTHTTDGVTERGRTRTTTSCDIVAQLVMCYGGRSCSNGNCIQDTKNCIVLCNCTAGYTGERCDVAITTTYSQETETHDVAITTTDFPETETHGVVMTTTESPEKETVSRSEPRNETVSTASPGQCSASYNCKHGHCPPNRIPPCVCDNGWDGYLCDLRCDLQCQNGGRCRVNTGNKKMACICYYNHSGAFCQFLKTTPSTKSENSTTMQSTGIGAGTSALDYGYVAGLVVGCVLIILVTMIVTCVILRKRHSVARLKFIYWFKPYEDDDRKTYDAFVSYKSSVSDGSHSSSPEELFVIHTLLPKLEGELGFRLCVHFRDFVPGCHITENVLDAIQNSRRIVLLLSPRYITDSFWTRFEYEQAQVAAMERTVHIIPVVFEDIAHVEIPDRTLKHILDTITYIRWPELDDTRSLDRFWTLLTLAMPKRKHPENITSLESNQVPTSNNVNERVSTTGVSNCPEIESSESIHLNVLEPKQSISDLDTSPRIARNGAAVGQMETIKGNVNMYLNILDI